MVTRRRKKKTTKRKTKRKKAAFGGYKIHPDSHLAKVIGKRPVAPSEMTKKLWGYIKKKKLARR